MALARSLAAGAALAAPACAADVFRVEQATLPAPFLLPSTSAGEPGKVNGVIEASAIEAVGDGTRLLVAHDRSAELFVAETANGQIDGRTLTAGRFPNGAKIPPKWEGLARDERGHYYVVGTHSGKTDEERASRSYLFRFRLTGGTAGRPFTIDEGSVRRWEIGETLKAALAREVSDPSVVARRKIEGLSVREVAAGLGKPARVELVVGLREPGDRVRVFAAEITADPADGASLPLTTLFTFDAGGREGVPAQLTSLLHLPAWNGFLVVTATEDRQNVFHGNTLWFIDDAQVARGTRVAPDSVHVFEPAMKAEGLCVLPALQGQDRRAVRLAVSFDNDPHSTHIPSRLQVLTVSRRPE